jgi:hypothetical protein
MAIFHINLTPGNLHVTYGSHSNTAWWTQLSDRIKPQCQPFVWLGNVHCATHCIYALNIIFVRHKSSLSLTASGGWLLGAFAKLWKATTSFVTSVCPSVRMDQLGFHWMDFHEIWYMSIFRKSVEKIQVSLKLDNNNGYFTGTPVAYPGRLCSNNLVLLKMGTMVPETCWVDESE